MLLSKATYKYGEQYFANIHAAEESTGRKCGQAELPVNVQVEV